MQSNEARPQPDSDIKANSEINNNFLSFFVFRRRLWCCSPKTSGANCNTPNVYEVENPTIKIFSQIGKPRFFFSSLDLWKKSFHMTPPAPCVDLKCVIILHVLFMLFHELLITSSCYDDSGVSQPFSAWRTSTAFKVQHQAPQRQHHAPSCVHFILTTCYLIPIV